MVKTDSKNASFHKLHPWKIDRIKENEEYFMSENDEDEVYTEDCIRNFKYQISV